MVYEINVDGRNEGGTWRTIEIWVKGHSRLLKMAPFDRSNMSSYWRSIVMVLSCLLSKIKIAIFLYKQLVVSINEREFILWPIRIGYKKYGGRGRSFSRSLCCTA